MSLLLTIFPINQGVFPVLGLDVKRTLIEFSEQLSFLLFVSALGMFCV